MVRQWLTPIVVGYPGSSHWRRSQLIARDSETGQVEELASGAFTVLLVEERSHIPTCERLGGGAHLPKIGTDIAHLIEEARVIARVASTRATWR